MAENLVVGEAGSAGLRRPISWRKERRRIRDLLASYHVHADPATPVDRLPPVGQALVAIVRAAEELKAYRRRGDVAHSILFLDEPTVFLPETEVEFLLSAWPACSARAPRMFPTCCSGLRAARRAR